MHPLACMLMLAVFLAFSQAAAVNLTNAPESPQIYPDDPYGCFLCEVSDVQDTACGPGRYDEENCDVPASSASIFDSFLLTPSATTSSEEGQKTGTWVVDGVEYTLYFDNYPSCSEASTYSKYKWFGFPIARATDTCPLQVAKMNRNQVITKNDQADHILEAQTVVYFFRWLYGDWKVLGWPIGYKNPTKDWILGLLMGNQDDDLSLPPFIFDGRVLWQHLGREMGGYRYPSRMALVWGKINRVKGVLFGDRNAATFPSPTSGSSLQLGEIKMWQRTFAGTFQYLNHGTIWRVFTETTKSFEDVFANFDNQYGWADEGMLGRPEREEGQPTPGLRDLWCYFIDALLDDVEWQASTWAANAELDLGEFEVEEEQIAEKEEWLRQFQDGIFTVYALSFRKDPQSIGPDNIIPNSKYGAWDNGPAGPFW
ncbi:hypothetical protein HDK90DRAFT_536250 [Phyllosticta capitalensis]|uniref:Uncharacterized protein n=1 Tax=Phyllosticta capitalensis TaxID=121624 RepID=A0ABR1YHK5_9PEZI